VGAAIESVRDYVDEVVVLDAESTDATLEVVTALGARVDVQPWAGFAAARRRLIHLCRHRWVLMIDADEIMPVAFWRELAQRGFPESGVTAYRMRRRMIYMGKPLKFAWNPDWKTVLFDRDVTEITARAVHERPEAAGRTVSLRARLIHDSYRSLREQYVTIARYAELAAADLDADGYRLRPWDLTLRPSWHVVRQLLLKGGLLDGWRGWLAALASGVDGYLRYAMLYERRQRARGLRDAGDS